MSAQNSKVWNIALWIAQVLLAFAFISAGALKTFSPIKELVTKGLTWANQVPEGLVRFIGISELLGGVGLILPSLLRIKPVLTVWAAAGLTTVMLLAALFHLYQGDVAHVLPSVVLGSIAAFIAWGRSRKAVIAAK